MLGTAVTFTWSEATDNVKVTKYRIVRGEETLGEVPAVGREFVYQSVDTDGSYEIQAGDDAGNWSSNGPSARVWANNGFRPGLLGNQNPGFMAPALMNPNGLQVNP